MTNFLEAAGLLLMARTDPPKFLLMRHHNRWDLPKGHAEPDEQTITTALRETEEETGIMSSNIVVDPDFRFVTEYDVQGKSRGDYRKRVTYFIGYLNQICDVRLTEHIDYRWWSWPQLSSIQSQTIDPLLHAARVHFEEHPERLMPPERSN